MRPPGEHRRPLELRKACARAKPVVLKLAQEDSKLISLGSGLEKLPHDFARRCDDWRTDIEGLQLQG